MKFNFNEGNQYMVQAERYGALLELYGPKPHNSDLVVRGLREGLLTGEEAEILAEWVCRYPTEVAWMNQAAEQEERRK